MADIAMEHGVGEAVRGLGEQVRGRVVVAEDEGYDAARAVHNGMFDRRPLAVLRAEQVGDVMAAVRFAGDHGLDLSVRGGGHSGPGFGTNDGGLVIDMGEMRTVRVDPQSEDCPRGRRCDMGRLQLCDACIRLGNHRRDHLDDWYRRPHPGRRDRLSHARRRPVDRQSDLGRRRHCGRGASHCERARERGSVLGAARWRWELRCRHLLRVSAARGRPGLCRAVASTTWRMRRQCFGCSTSSSAMRRRSLAGSRDSRSHRRCRSSRRTDTATPCSWWWCTGPGRLIRRSACCSRSGMSRRSSPTAPPNCPTRR